MTNSVIANNVAGTGGGGLYTYDSVNTVISTTWQDNRASAGGAIDSIGNSKLTVLDSLLTHNRAEQSGGGLYAGGYEGTLISNTHIISNTGWTGNGGGLFAAQAITIVNSLINQNATHEYGAGASFFSSPQVLIQNSDIKYQLQV